MSGVGEPNELDEQAKRGDPDRWLASRFVTDPARRAEVVALYALNLELARVAEAVRTPLLGEIRFAWWREGLEELGARPPRSPALAALATAAAEGRLDLAALEALIEARYADLEPAPFPDEAALTGYLDATAGGMMRAAAHLLDPAADPATVASGGRAWGWASLLRAGPGLAASGRLWTPASWGEPDAAEVARHVAHRVGDALAAAKAELRGLPVAAFPAVAYAALARDYARGRAPGELARRVRITAAVLRGAI